MINPSAIGWIDKFFIKQKHSHQPEMVDANLFYKNVRNTGFFYGHIISFETAHPIDSTGLFKDEISKIALLNSLFGIYILNFKDKNPEKFIQNAVDFYNKMNPQGFNLFKKVLPNSSNSNKLEKIIDERVQTNTNLINKSFSNVVTNALLFIDVLAFQQYLIHGDIPEKYFRNIEETIVSLITLALKTKVNKSKHDDLLIKLFEASVRYSKFSKVDFQNLEILKLDYFSNDLEKYYLVDIAGLALWSDGIIEKEEAYFLHTLADIMNVPDSFVKDSIESTHEFISKHKKEIPYFNYSNPVKNFYDQTTEVVVKLINRNKKRLIKEISESKELMILLAYSTTRDLDKSEKKKVRKQLLDVCKSIPSLTIFLLPGGSLLLPILIKFIPKLLPSAFNENLDIE